MASGKAIQSKKFITGLIYVRQNAKMLEKFDFESRKDKAANQGNPKVIHPTTIRIRKKENKTRKFKT